MLTKIALVASALVVLVVLMTPETQAATITVTSTASGTGVAGDCTLQEAIQAANTDTAVDGCTAGSGADIILFCNCTLSIAGPFQTVVTDGPIGLPDITSDITIQGLGPSVSIIERSPAALDFSVFRVTAGGRLRLENLTVRYGKNVGGGGIINRGGTVELFIADMLDNNATGTITDPNAGGGAIANFGGTLNVMFCDLGGNTSTGSAGAIRNDATLIIDGSNFSSNLAVRGGAIESFFVPSATTTITNSSFTFNEAGLFGGALHIHAVLNVTSTGFFTNKAGADDGAQNGGGAIEGDGDFTITDCTFDGNQALAVTGSGDGGAIRTIGGAVLRVVRSTFSNNTANNNGGAIALFPNTTFEIRNSTFSANSTDIGDGGALWLDNNVSSGLLNNTTVAGNAALGNGGGLVLTSTASNVTMKNTILAKNTSASAGPDCSTPGAIPLISAGHNIIGDSTNCTVLAATGDQIGGAGTPIDPVLVPLQDNGGPTLTMALRPGSPAVDNGDPNTPLDGQSTRCEATDQRGVARPDGTACDIGAYEGVLPQANLAVTKTDTPDPVAFGNNITYTITVTNGGPDTATGVSLSDTLPNATGFVSAMPSQGSCMPPFGGQLVCDLGTMTNGSVATVTVIFNANQVGTISNSVFVSSPSTDDPGFSNNFALETTTVTRDFDLRVQKTGFPDPVAKGNDITYTVQVFNQGTVAINNVTLTDTFSGAAVSVLSAMPSQGSCTLGNPITCNLGLIPSVSGVTIGVAVNATAIGTVTNTATATTTDTDPDLTNNAATITTDVRGTANLTITKTGSPDPVPVGSNVTYTIVVTNNGPDPATNVTLMDSAPFGSTFVSINASQGTCTSGGGTGTCDLGTVGIGGSATVTFVVTADFPCVLNNTAFVNFTEFPFSASASATTTVGAGAAAGTADLSITKATLPTQIISGDNVTYTIVVSNAGPDPATNVVVTDDLPSQFGFTVGLVSATPTQGSCSSMALQVVCMLGTINLNGSATVTIVASLTATPPPATASNFASVTASQTDPDTLNNTASADTSVVPRADLATGITDSPDPVGVGGTLTYTATLTNNGPDLHIGLINFWVQLPLSVNVTSFPAGCTASVPATNFNCNTGNLAAGVTLTHVFVTTPTTPGTLMAFANAGGSIFDPDPSNDLTSTTTTVTALQADLSVTKSDSPDPVDAGLNLTYTITISNGGPDDATNVVLTDSLPAGVSFVSATASQGTCSQASGTVTCNLGTVTTSVPATVTIVVRPTAAAGSSITNTASVTSSASDPNLTDNSATASTTVTLPTLLGPSPYLSVNDSPFLAGIQTGMVAVETSEDGRFDVPGVTVNGGSPIAPSGITDSVDGDDGAINGSGTAGRSFFFGAGSTGITFTFSAAVLGALPTQAGIVWTDGQGTTTFEAFDAAGTSLGVIGPVTLDDGSIAGTTGEDRFFGVTHSGGISAIRISNTSGGIEVDHLQYGPVPSPVNADLTTTKTGAPNPVNAGTNVTYTITVTNAGVGTASGVMLTDVLPAGTMLVSATPAGACTGTTTISCNLGSLGPGAQATVSIVATVPGSGTIINTAAVASGSNELFVFNNSSMASVSVTPIADLSITKGDLPDPVAATDNLTYTVLVTNNGPSPATGVTLTDTLPAGVTFVSATPTQGTCTPAAGSVTCNLGALNMNASATVTIIVTPTATGMITNAAVVSAAEPDPNLGNNTATQDTTVVAASADVLVTKADAPDPVIINQNLTYTLTVRNNGPQAAQNVVLTDTLPTGPTFVSATAPCTQASGIVTCNLGTLASGAQTVISIVVTPTAAGSLVNMASASSTTADPNTANNSASVTTTVSSIPFTASFPAGQPGTATVNSGGTVTVTVMVTPNQPGITVAVACGPPLPPDTTCTVQPPSLMFPTLTPQTVTITIQTTFCFIGATPPRGPQFPVGGIRVMWPMLLVLTLLLWVGLARHHEQWKRLTPVVALLLFVVVLTGCVTGQGAPPPRTVPFGTIPGTYTVPITFSSSGQSQTLNFTLTVNP